MLFTTQDVVFATFLLSRGISLQDIMPLDKFHSAFVFEEPPKELVFEFVSGKAVEKSIINNYRHLIKDAFDAQKAQFGGGGNA